jgi:hypothetical protein
VSEASVKDETGPAFPVNPCGNADTYSISHPGMSLLDWYAGQALATVASMRYSDGEPYSAALIAHRCYEIADAMIETRKRTE